MSAVAENQKSRGAECSYLVDGQHVRVHADERVQHAHCHLAFKSQSAEEAVVEATAALAAELLGDDVTPILKTLLALLFGQQMESFG